MTTDTASVRRQFRQLHESGLFVMPNPWDRGSAVRLQRLGFPALATTSSGLGWSLGRDDYTVSLGELVEHVGQMTSVLEVPLNVDSERLFADSPDGIGAAVDALAEAGAAGCSIEDWDPAADAIDPIEVAVERVGAAAEACRRHGIVLTARAENLLHGVDDLDDTTARLVAYRAAGAEVLYAPALVAAADIERVVTSVGAPVNVLRWPGAPDVAGLASLGVRRVSTGGALARVAYDAMEATARDLR